jgi:hypothetical protein
MMHVSISRTWLFSRTAQRVYLLCAILNLALLATRIGVVAAMASAGISTLPPTAALLVKGFLFPEIAGSAVLFVGMSYCWLGFSGSYKKKVLWLVLLYFFLITTPIYYFAVYRPMASRAPAELGPPALSTA